MNGEQLVGHGGREVHWTAVHADNKGSLAKKPDQFDKVGLVQ